MESKFEALVEQFEKYLVNEAGFPPLSTLKPTGAATPTGTTESPLTSAVEAEIDSDPSVQNARKQALQKVQQTITKQ
jgi:hypothetical protein